MKLIFGITSAVFKALNTTIKLCISLIRFIFVLLMTLIIGPLYFFSCYLIGEKKAFYLAKLWGQLFCIISGVKVDRYYYHITDFTKPVKRQDLIKVSKSDLKEKLFLSRGAAILFSHTSFADAAFISIAATRALYFVAKRELYKMPIIGQLMYANKALAIPRKDIPAAIKEYKKGEERLISGDLFMVAPEGTRHDGITVGDFKSGPFIFAAQSKADMIPLVLCGGHKIWKPHTILINGSLKRKSVAMVYGSRISFKDIYGESKTILEQKPKRDRLKKDLRDRYQEIYDIFK